MNIDLEKNGWSIVPGPKKLPEEPWPSFDVDTLDEVAPQDLAQLLVDHPAIHQNENWDGDWWNWGSIWKTSGGEVCIGFTLMGENDEFWGGSELSGCCKAGELFELLTYLRKSGIMAYLHNEECDLYGPDSFKENFCEKDLGLNKEADPGGSA